jgi:hypothetical protein
MKFVVFIDLHCCEFDFPPSTGRLIVLVLERARDTAFEALPPFAMRT